MKSRLQSHAQHQAAAPARPSRRPARRIAAGGALAFVVTGAVLAGGAQWTAHEVRGALASVGVDVAGVSVDPVSGSVTLDRVAASHDGLRISVGSIATPGHFGLSSAAEAAGPVTLTDIEISSKQLTVRIPRLEVAGDNVDEARLRAIFDKTSATPLAKRLSDISVSRATLPELVLVQKSDKAMSSSTWKQITITDLKNGVAGAITSSGATFATKAGETSSSGAIGQTAMEKVNLGLVARLYTEAAANEADRQLQPAYGAFSASDITVRSDDASFAIKSVSGKDFKARLLNTPLLELTASIEAVKNPDDLEPKARAAYYSSVADILEAFSFGEAAVTGMTFDVPDESDDEGEEADKETGKQAEAKEKSAKSDKPAPRVRGEIASLSFGSAVAQGGLSFSGLKIAPVEGDHVSIGEGNVSNFMAKLADMFRKLSGAAADGKDDNTALASLTPAAAGLTLKNIDVNVASPDAPGERVKFTIQGFSGSYSDPVNGVPTALKTNLDRLVIDLPRPKKGDDEEDDDSPVNATLTKLHAMGYDKLDLSASIDGKWEAATKDLRVNAFSFGAANLGSIRLTGLLGNVSQELFTASDDRRQQLLLSSRLKNLSLDVTDSGFAKRFAELQAKEQGDGDATQVRAGWAALAQMLLPSMIGSSDGAKALTGALGKFIRDSGSLSLSATSRKPEGDQMSELIVGAASGNPDALFQALDFKATAKQATEK
ncbi:hypothetical protein GCM10019059_09890 [Camelimonas fluminis]|uniref:AsmA protein n=1 Tax=Camelimonas fluminis TaxID=1576911 RepID=A0ABV7UDT6_9HYPH|nr:hypothetical protein [Camelimonas fluminis]GHE52503.1 hypothetical protein GCM10019059_09890 [Camelimonas fluminis]